jgi:hypothetical protein
MHDDADRIYEKIIKKGRICGLFENTVLRNKTGLERYSRRVRVF